MNVLIVPLVDLVLICQIEDAELIVAHIPLLDVDIHLALRTIQYKLQYKCTESRDAVVHN